MNCPLLLFGHGFRWDSKGFENGLLNVKHVDNIYFQAPLCVCVCARARVCRATALQPEHHKTVGDVFSAWRPTSSTEMFWSDGGEDGKFCSSGVIVLDMFYSVQVFLTITESHHSWDQEDIAIC